MQDPPISTSTTTSQSPVHPPQSALRGKTDAAAQTISTTPERTAIKHVRFADEGQGPVPARKRLAIEVTSSPGGRVVHINPDGYVVRPFDLVTEPWVTESSARYLYKILSYHNEAGYWFPIHRVAPAGSWAVVDENPLVMHRVRLGRPLLLWIVGVLHDIYLCAPRAGASPILHATVDFLRECDRSQVTSIHNAAASVPLATLDRLSVRSPACEDEGPQTHNDVYDGRRKIQCKSTMTTISPGQILGGDIVLLECTVVREEDVTNVRTVTFLLNSVYWLVEKPRPPTAVTQRVADFPDIISAD